MIKVKMVRFLIRTMGILFWRGKAPKNLDVVDREIRVQDNPVKIRIYKPQDKEGPLPVVIYFHGGGFILGDLTTVDGTCRDIAANAEHMVVSVDYRLAPESPFPAAVHDAIGAIEWVQANAGVIGADVNRIFVAGDSAGGNLAAVSALNKKHTEPNLIKGQILLYPVTHHYSYDTASYTENAKGQGLTRNMMMWFWDTYYQDNSILEAGELTHPLSTPLAEDDLSGLPPALVMTAELDPLRDEGIEYANKMAAAGVRVSHSLYKGTQHGFVGSMGPTDEHKRGIAEIANWLQSMADNNTQLTQSRRVNA